MKTTIRLDKMLGNLGYGTRSGIRLLVKQGAVTVNNQLAKDPGMQINPRSDIVILDGKTIQYRDTVYVMLHKPAGVVSATEDSRDRTVLDLLDSEITALAPFPVGRLDKDTEGLLLLMTDGKLAHELLSPKKHVPKTYRALVAGAVGDSEAKVFAQGVTLDDGYVTMPAQLKVLSAALTPEEALEGSTSDSDEFREELRTAMRLARRNPTTDYTSLPLSWIELTIHEGKFHQVKRMFEAVGHKVLYLRRVSMGPIKLDPALAPGQWRELSEDEVEGLRNYRKEGKA